jgi:GT2 family glycosyltransferase
MVTLGILTYSRPTYLEKVCRSVTKHLQVDRVYIHDDGSDPKYAGSYKRAFKRLPDAVLQLDPVNRGCAQAKNALLHQMLEDGADWLFLMEDDILITSPEAVSGYLRACETSGLQHLSYAHHGPMNVSGAKEVDGSVSYFPHYVGAWSVYSRESLEDVGLFDEHFVNAWEHVELTLRLARAGYTDPRPWFAADATGSENWLTEIPGSIEDSVIRPRYDWQSNIDSGLQYWRENDPETYGMIFA